MWEFFIAGMLVLADLWVMQIQIIVETSMVDGLPPGISLPFQVAPLVGILLYKDQLHCLLLRQSI